MTASPTDTPSHNLVTPPDKRASLSTPRIVFLVIAAAAPLASMIGNLPIALGRGNGAACGRLELDEPTPVPRNGPCCSRRAEPVYRTAGSPISNGPRIS